VWVKTVSESVPHSANSLSLSCKTNKPCSIVAQARTFRHLTFNFQFTLRQVFTEHDSRVFINESFSNEVPAQELHPYPILYLVSPAEEIQPLVLVRDFQAQVATLQQAHRCYLGHAFPHFRERYLPEIYCLLLLRADDNRVTRSCIRLCWGNSQRW
jgi:hypothetical protein